MKTVKIPVHDFETIQKRLSEMETVLTKGFDSTRQGQPAWQVGYAESATKGIIEILKPYNPTIKQK